MCSASCMYHRETTRVATGNDKNSKTVITTMDWKIPTMTCT